MRATIIPAQVTTVEDKIAGRLSLSQLALLALPIFGGSLLYAILPPNMDFAWYKVIFIAGLATLSLILAVRIKGKIVLLWLIILLRYRMRPRRYLFSKNSICCRVDYPIVKEDKVSPPVTKQSYQKLDSHLTGLDLDFNNSVKQLEFNGTKKGKFYVKIRS